MTFRIATCSLAAAALLPCRALPLHAQTPQPAALDTAFIRHVAEMSRQRITQLMTSTSEPENQRAAQQYRDALSDLERGAWGDAATTLQAVLQRAPQNPLYRADLGYAHLRQGQYDAAGTDYTRAYQTQQQNGWLVLGIAMVHAEKREFADAAGAADLAAQTDTTVIDSAFVIAAAGWFEAAGDRTRALHYARLGSQRWPGEPTAWLRIASYLAAKNDTTPEGMAAIRRYRTLRADDKLGQALYAKYLYDAGQMDSAISLAQSVAADSFYRPFAATVLLQASITALRRDPDKALQLLAIGQPWADSTLRAGYANITGRAQLTKLPRMFGRYEDYPSCDSAQAIDTLVNATERNLRAGMSFDSNRTRMIVDSLLPPYKGNAQAALHNCKTSAQLQQQQRRGGARPRPSRP